MSAYQPPEPFDLEVKADVDGHTHHLDAHVDWRQYGDHQFVRSYIQLTLPDGQKVGFWGIEAWRWAVMVGARGEIGLPKVVENV